MLLGVDDIKHVLMGISVLGTGIGVWLIVIFKDILSGWAQAIGTWIWERRPKITFFPPKKEAKPITACVLTTCPMASNGYLKEKDFFRMMLDYPNRTELSDWGTTIQNTQMSNHVELMRRMDNVERTNTEKLDGYIKLLNEANTKREIERAVADAVIKHERGPN